jgi:hypothetical protein
MIEQLNISNKISISRKDWVKAFLFFSLIFISTCVLAQKKVIIKLDDFGVLKNNNAARVLDTLIARNIKVSIGVIPKNFSDSARHEYAKYINATNSKNEKLVEIWYHGYDHSRSNPPNNNVEFGGTPYEFQKGHFKLGDKIVKKALGVKMRTFGAPFNNSDSSTVKIIKKNKAYKVFLCRRGEEGFKDGVLYLSNQVGMESGTGIVNFAFFSSRYQPLKDKYKDYILLEGHPNGWDAPRLSEFLKIIELLALENVEFVLPYEYYLAFKKNSKQ